MDKQEKMVELSRRTKSKDLKNLIELIYLSNNAYSVTEEVFEWDEDLPTCETVQKLFNCSRTKAEDLVNTLKAINFSHDIGNILFVSGEHKQKMIEALKQRLQKED